MSSKSNSSNKKPGVKKNSKNIAIWKWDLVIRTLEIKSKNKTNHCCTLNAKRKSNDKKNQRNNEGRHTTARVLILGDTGKKEQISTQKPVFPCAIYTF